MKEKKTFKRSWIAILFAFIAVAVIIFCLLSKVSKNKYWESSHLDDLSIDMTRYETYLSEIDSNQNNTEEIVHLCNENAVPVPAECVSFFENCNKLIKDFFLEVYSIDVSGKLDKLQVKKSEYPDTIAESVGGSYASQTLYINAALLDGFLLDVSEVKEPSISDNKTFSFKMLRNVYIHETIHYLGFSNEPQFGCFTEAITESLTEKVTEYGGIKYENLTGYGGIKDLATQIIDADDSLVRSVLTDNDYLISEHFNEVLGGEYAGTFDELVFILRNGGSKQYSEIPYLAQYFAYEYVKAVCDSSEEYSKAMSKSITHGFELKWFMSNIISPKAAE